MTNGSKSEIVVLGTGCFWCTEALFQRLPGVTSVSPGYTGGIVPNPTYEQVCSGDTGHAEVARIEFDPEKLPFSHLLEFFWAVHDPKSLNRQGPDSGSQYRSAIFYTTPAQGDLAKSQLQPGFVTEIKPLDKFYPAENYHQNYFNNHSDAPYCQLVIGPKVRHFFP